MIYTLAYCGREDYVPYIVEGPEVDNWQELCASLLPEAAELAVANCIISKNYCGWPEIVDAILTLLEARGYKELKPPEFRCWGPSIILREEDPREKHLPPSSRVRIIRHNKQQP